MVVGNDVICWCACVLVDSESGSVGGYTNLVIGNGLGLGILFDATDQPTQ